MKCSLRGYQIYNYWNALHLDAQLQKSHMILWFASKCQIENTMPHCDRVRVTYKLIKSSF